MGAYYTMTTAYAAAYRSAVSDAEVTGDANVRDPGNGWQCWAVVRTHQRVECKPHQCPMRRRSGARKGEPARHCCHGHRQREDEAGRWEQYERAKQELRELDLEPSEYERRVAELAERLGV